jgi:hypothetical protein
MRDLAPDLPASDIELVAEPACCPGGVCGPIFETPLLELAFNRIRDFVRSKKAATVAEATLANPLPDQFLSTAPVVAAPPPRPQKDAPHD